MLKERCQGAELRGKSFLGVKDIFVVVILTRTVQFQEDVTTRNEKHWHLRLTWLQ